MRCNFVFGSCRGTFDKSYQTMVYGGPFQSIVDENRPRVVLKGS